MKRSIFILTTILGGLGGLFVNNNASAMVVTTIEERWWTIPEVIEINKEAEREMVERCGEDVACYETVAEEQVERDQKFLTLGIFRGFKIMVTGLNLETGEIKIFTNEDDPIAEQLTGVSGKGKIAKAGVLWLEDRVSHSNYSGYIWGTRESTDGMHFFYQYDGEELVKGKENTVLSREDLKSNPNNILEFYMIKDNGDNSVGAVNYSSCLESPNYKEGMDCQLMISENEGMDFMPIDNSVVGEEDKNKESSSVDETGKGSIDYTENNLVKNNLDAENNSTSSNDNDNNTPAVSAPETGTVPTSQTNAENNSYIIWIGIAALFVTILSFLIKKLKKSVDFCHLIR